MATEILLQAKSDVEDSKAEHYGRLEPVQQDSTGEDAHSIKSTMYYLDRTHLHDPEKPYSMRYQPDDDIPQTNFKKIERPITVKSMRQPGAGPFHLNECGFQLIKLKSQLLYDEFWDKERVKRVYIQEVKDALKRELGAKYVYALDYAVC
jgi:hypothetical protein